MPNRLELSDAEFRAVVDAGELTIGGSDVGAILGVNQYRTASEVWDSLMGVGPGFNSNRHTERGNDLENYIISRYSRQQKRVVYRVRQRKTCVDGIWMRYTPDGVIAPSRGAPHGGRGIFEAKAPQEHVYEGYRRDGVDPSYVAQIHHYMDGFDLHWGAFAIFNPNGWQLWPIDVACNRDFLNDELKPAVHRFWFENVLPRVRPEPDMRLVSQIPVVGAEVVDLSRNEEWGRIAATLRAAKQRLDLAQHSYDLAVERAKSYLDGCGVDAVRGRGVKAYYREQGRKTFDRELFAREYPDIDLDRYTRQIVVRPFRPYFD